MSTFSLTFTSTSQNYGATYKSRVRLTRNRTTWQTNTINTRTLSGDQFLIQGDAIGLPASVASHAMFVQVAPPEKNSVSKAFCMSCYMASQLMCWVNVSGTKNLNVQSSKVPLEGANPSQNFKKILIDGWLLMIINDFR